MPSGQVQISAYVRSLELPEAGPQLEGAPDPVDFKSAPQAVAIGAQVGPATCRVAGSHHRQGPAVHHGLRERHRALTTSWGAFAP